MKKVLSVFGTRPEAIKMAPLVNCLAGTQQIESRVCVTAQHREMLDMVLKIFGIVPDWDLNLMSHGQTISGITVKVVTELGAILDQYQPELVLVHGDTTTSFAAALASFYRKIPVGHIEAGLRTGNIYSPFPEEMNRRLTGTLATYHFAPTEGNRRNLLQTGVSDTNIFVTGNTVIDALHLVLKKDYNFPIPLLNKIDYRKKRVILLTAHRRENWGIGLENIFRAVSTIIKDFPDTELIFPVHPNKIVADTARRILAHTERIHLIEPLDYVPFVNLIDRSYLILTDSGGIQEEAPSLGKPVLVLRTETERPEAVEAGTVRMAGVEYERIYELTAALLKDEEEYKKMARAVNPYGDGKAAQRIVDIIKKL